MIAIAVNAATIIIGSLIGLLINKNVKKSLTDAIIVGIGFFTVYMGIMGLNSSVNSIHKERRKLIAKRLSASGRHQHKSIVAGQKVPDNRLLIPFELVKSEMDLQRLK